MMSDAFVVALVAPLRHQIDESTIIRAIVAIDIYPVNRTISSCCGIVVAVFHGPIIERLKVSVPFGANPNSTRTIVFILWRFRIIAPPTHIAPNCIKPRMCHSMLGIPFNALF
jgi:hypothetical protein